MLSAHEKAFPRLWTQCIESIGNMALLGWASLSLSMSIRSTVPRVCVCVLPSIWTMLSSCTASGDPSAGQDIKVSAGKPKLLLCISIFFILTSQVWHRCTQKSPWSCTPGWLTQTFGICYWLSRVGIKKNTRWNGEEPLYNRLHRQIEKYSGISFNRLPEAKREEQ